MSEQAYQRTHTCGELGAGDAGTTAVLAGWVARRRDHGGVIFIDLRDRYGITQVVFKPESEAVYSRAKQLRGEFVIAVRGKVSRRLEGKTNENLATGAIELIVEGLDILNEALTPPFEIDDQAGASEELRLRYRYLDLRRPAMQRNLQLRHRLYQVVRSFFDGEGFLEIETPLLMRSTPEGARDFLVPSRIHHGKFYALPQSPQTYKQILMVAGLDRYFQIVKCFRDEDLRADRQPEFTQIDVEMSFVGIEEVLTTMEALMVRIFSEIAGVELQTPLPRLTWREAMDTWGSDKPDLRFGMPLADVSEFGAASEFRVFRQTVDGGGVVKGVCVPGGAAYSRKRIDELTEEAKAAGAGGLVAIKIGEGDWDSNLSRFFDEGTRGKITAAMEASGGDLLLFVADKLDVANSVLGSLRTRIGAEAGLIDTEANALAWVLEFPLLAWDEDEQRYFAMHHPFTSPMPEDHGKLESAPGEVRARAYDLVLNGNEIAGGSIRIHTREMQDKMFKLLNIGEQEARDKFGFLLDAFEYGAPPHGGIAFGFDRLAMLLAGRRTIRDVIAFPKTNSALSLMDGAPNKVDEDQLRELGIRLR